MQQFPTRCVLTHRRVSTSVEVTSKRKSALYYLPSTKNRLGACIGSQINTVIARARARELAILRFSRVLVVAPPTTPRMASARPGSSARRPQLPPQRSSETARPLTAPEWHGPVARRRAVNARENTAQPPGRPSPSWSKARRSLR